MDLKTLWENFDVIAEAENGIPELRELILDLAVKGKLTFQLYQEEVSIQYDQKYFQNLFNKKIKISTPKQLPSEEIPFIIPRNWKWYNMGSIGISQTGSTPSTNQPEFYGNDYPFVKPGDIDSKGSIEYRNQVGLSKEGIKQGRLVPKNSVLMVSIGGSIGKVGLVDKDCSCNQQINYITCFSGVIPKFIFYVLKSASFQELVLSNSSSTTMPILNKSKWELLPVPIPPLEEQQRIVKKVDELMALCDRAQARKENRNELQQQLRQSAIHALETAETEEEFNKSWHFVRDNFSAIATQSNGTKKLKQLILNLAIRGKLTKKSFDDTPASELLSAIQTLKKQFFGNKIPKNNKNFKAIEEKEIPFSIPKKWKWVRLGDITICRDGERIPLSKSDRDKRQGNYDYYGASGVIDKIDDYIFDQPLLLIGEDGANLINRSTPIAFIASGKYWVNNHAHVLDSISYDVLEYLEIFINAIDLTPYISGTAQPKMNQAKMNSILVAVPPVEEQKRIVTKVNELMEICDRVEENLRKKEELASAISASVIHHLEL